MEANHCRDADGCWRPSHASLALVRRGGLGLATLITFSAVAAVTAARICSILLWRERVRHNIPVKRTACGGRSPSRQTPMMKTVAVAILLVALLPAVSGAQSHRSVFLLGEGRDNVMQRWEVARDKWQSQPKWTPMSDGPPPLAIAKAVESGEAWLRKQHPDLQKLAVSQVTLKAQGQSGPGTREGWFYRIEYQPVVAGQRLWGGEFVAVVLFDGTVVVPRKEAYGPSR